MNLNTRGSLGIAVIAALIGLCLMVFFLVTGAVSPEPGDHPAWMELFGRTLPGHILHLTVAFLCLPAFLIASFLASWGLSLWMIACLLQTGIFFGSALGIAEMIRSMRRSAIK
jgi:hypothetical protein